MHTSVSPEQICLGRVCCLLLPFVVAKVVIEVEDDGSYCATSSEGHSGRQSNLVAHFTFMHLSLIHI